jgi:hypothetical protein
MSNETKTKEIVTVNGHTAVLKTSITYGENLQIVDIYLDETLTKAAANRAADKKGSELVIVSIDGQSDNIYAAFCALDVADARQIAKAVKEVLDPKA